jgi:hypothetical protein
MSQEKPKICPLRQIAAILTITGAISNELKIWLLASNKETTDVMRKASECTQNCAWWHDGRCAILKR